MRFFLRGGKGKSNTGRMQHESNPHVLCKKNPRPTRMVWRGDPPGAALHALLCQARYPCAPHLDLLQSWHHRSKSSLRHSA